ncbi:MAG TPA: hypothetical protein VKU91_04630, partial [Acidimicrobiales bacterium]|nr:hypothetical protein [Acidimicrobiales bacterium]
TVGMLEDALSRISPRRHGTRHLRQLLEHRRSEPTPDSPLEQRIYRHLQPLQPFVAHFQVVLGGRLAVLDAAWPEYRVAAEIDGRSWRAMSRSAHDRESRKLNALTAHRWSVAHLTTTMDQPECVGSVLELMPERAFPDVRARFGAGVRFR